VGGFAQNARSRLVDFLLTSKNSTPIEAWAREVSLTTTAWTDVVSHAFTMAREGVVTGIGVDLESPEAFATVDFRVVRGTGANARPFPGLMILMPRNECLARPIQFMVPVWVDAGHTVTLQARTSTVAVTHKVWGRLVGSEWQKLTDYQIARLSGVPLNELTPDEQDRYGGMFCYGDPIA